MYRPPPPTPSPNFPERRGVCTQATFSTLGTSLLDLITFPGCSHKAVFLPSGSSSWEWNRDCTFSSHPWQLSLGTYHVEALHSIRSRFRFSLTWTYQIYCYCIYRFRPCLLSWESRFNQRRKFKYLARERTPNHETLILNLTLLEPEVEWLSYSSDDISNRPLSALCYQSVEFSFLKGGYFLFQRTNWTKSPLGAL